MVPQHTYIGYLVISAPCVRSDCCIFCTHLHYCPIIPTTVISMWHFSGKSVSKKCENIQDRALRFVVNDKVSTYESLLDRCGYTTLHIRRIKTIVTKVFKSVYDLHPTFTKEMFNRKEKSFDLRDKYIIHFPRFNNITNEKNTFTYYASHI